MSEVNSVSGVGSVGGEGEDKNTGQEQVVVSTTVSPPTKMVAPALRVEELRDDDTSSHTNSLTTCGSEEEGGALSHGEGHSDSERTLTKSPMGEFQPPDDELKEKIIKQVEFYFSDVNILKDAFLLKHVRRNKQGYVSLKLITSFKKVKSLTKDYRVVAYSLRQSDELEVNEEGTKVRRIKTLPDYDETTPSRTVVAVNLVQDNPTIESVAELFKQCGEIALIRVLRPGKPVPQDVKKHMNKHPEIGSTVCAVIEFDDHEAAKKACEMTDRDDWRKGMRVVLLASKKGKDKDKERKKKDGDMSDGKEKERGDEKSGDEQKRDSDGGEKGEKKRRKRGGKRKNSRVDELISSENPNYSSDSGGEGFDPAPIPRNRSASAGAVTDTLGSELKSQRHSLSPKPDHNRLSPSNTPRTSPAASPRSSPRGSPNTGRRKCHGRSPLADLSAGESPRPSPHGSPESRRRSQNLDDKDTGSSPSSPWVQRRLKAQAAGQIPASSPGTSPRLGRRLPDGTLDKSMSPRMAHEEHIIRQPRGPDGTKGFSVGRGKNRSETM